MKLIIPFLAALAICAQAAPDTLKNLDAELQKKWPANRTVNIVFHGHSVPSGYHKTPDVRPFESYPHLVNVALKGKYPHSVMNVIVTAIGGENCVPGAERFERDVLTHKPDLILIDYALNDRKLSLEETEAAWRKMVASARTAGVPVVLLTPTGDLKADLTNPEDPLTRRAELIRRIAKDEDVLLADVSAAWIAELAKGTPQEKLMSQGNHPNLRGHTLAAEVILKALHAAGLGA